MPIAIQQNAYSKCSLFSSVCGKQATVVEFDHFLKLASLHTVLPPTLPLMDG